MKPHPRIRKTIKWSVTVLAILLLAGWLASGWVDARRTKLDQIDMVKDGRFTHEYLSVGFGSAPGRGWEMLRTPRWLLGYEYRHDRRGYTKLCLPLWMPIAPAALLTLVCWLFDVLADRRARRNRCPRCGYDRAGLAASAKCPECGAAPLVRV